MKKAICTLLCLFLISGIAFADFSLIDGDNVYKIIKNSDSVLDWWRKSSELDKVRLWLSVYFDIREFDPGYDVGNLSIPIGIIGIDKAANDIHVYSQDRTGNYRHIQLFRIINDQSGEMIYETSGVSLSNARERLKRLTSDQFELTYDVLQSYNTGE